MSETLRATNDQRQAFNDGCDARRDGLPIAACPYSCSQQKLLWLYWRDGWWQMHFQYGVDARWPILALRPIQEVKAS